MVLKGQAGGSSCHTLSSVDGMHPAATGEHAGRPTCSGMKYRPRCNALRSRASCPDVAKPLKTTRRRKTRPPQSR